MKEYIKVICNPSFNQGQVLTILQKQSKKRRKKNKQAAEQLPKTTPIIEAVRRNFFDVLVFLISTLKFDANQKNIDNQNPLDIACKLGYKEIAEYLVQYINATPSGPTQNVIALEYSIKRDWLTVVQSLIAKNPLCKEFKTVNDDTALHIALTYNSQNVAMYFIKEKPEDLLICNKNGRVPFNMILSFGYEKLLAYVLRNTQVTAVTSLTHQCGVAYSPLEILAKNINSNTLKCIYLLLSSGAGLDSTKIPKKIFTLLNESTKPVNFLLLCGEQSKGDWQNKWITEVEELKTLIGDPRYRFEFTSIARTAAHPALQMLPHVQEIHQLLIDSALAYNQLNIPPCFESPLIFSDLSIVEIEKLAPHEVVWRLTNLFDIFNYQFNLFGFDANKKYYTYENATQQEFIARTQILLTIVFDITKYLSRKNVENIVHSIHNLIQMFMQHIENLLCSLRVCFIFANLDTLIQLFEDFDFRLKKQKFLLGIYSENYVALACRVADGKLFIAMCYLERDQKMNAFLLCCKTYQQMRFLSKEFPSFSNDIEQIALSGLVAEMSLISFKLGWYSKSCDYVIQLMNLKNASLPIERVFRLIDELTDTLKATDPLRIMRLLNVCIARFSSVVVDHPLMEVAQLSKAFLSRANIQVEECIHIRFQKISRLLVDQFSVAELFTDIFPAGVAWSDPIRELVTGKVDAVEDAQGLLDLLRTEITQPEMPAEGDFVRIMSLHKSKGLTSRVTIIVGCIHGLIPFVDNDLPPAERAAHLQEQRRVFYVALTRAKEVLVVSSVASIPRAMSHQIGAVLRGGNATTATRLLASFSTSLGRKRPLHFTDRLRLSPRKSVHGVRVHRGRASPRPDRAPGPAAAGRGTADRRSARPGARLCARPADRTPRPQAREHSRNRATAVQDSGPGSGASSTGKKTGDSRGRRPTRRPSRPPSVPPTVEPISMRSG